MSQKILLDTFKEEDRYYDLFKVYEPTDIVKGFMFEGQIIEQQCFNVEEIKEEVSVQELQTRYRAVVEQNNSIINNIVDFKGQIEKLSQDVEENENDLEVINPRIEKFEEILPLDMHLDVHVIVDEEDDEEEEE